MATIQNSGQKTYKADLAAIFEAVQQQRSDLLTMARELQLAARLLGVAEARRLAVQGDTADARIAHFVAGSDIILQRAAALEVETQIANIRVPPVTKTETLLQGRVTDEAAKAAAHVQVTLVDDKGVAVAGVPAVETDDSGYYAFVLKPEQTQAIGAGRKLSLQIANDSAKLVPAAAPAFTLAPGTVAVSEVALKPAELEKLRLQPNAAATVRTKAATSKQATRRAAPKKKS